MTYAFQKRNAIQHCWPKLWDFTDLGRKSQSIAIVAISEPIICTWFSIRLKSQTNRFVYIARNSLPHGWKKDVRKQFVLHHHHQALKAARGMVHLHFGAECEETSDVEELGAKEEPHEPSIECESQEDLQAAIQEVQRRYQQKHEDLALQFKKEVKQMQESSSGRWMKEQQDMGWIEFPNGMRMRPRFQYKTWVKDAPGTGGAAMSESESSSSSSSSSSIGSKQGKSRSRQCYKQASAPALAASSSSSSSSGSKHQPHGAQMDALPSDSLAQINVSLVATGKSGKTFATDFCAHGETLARSCLEKWCTHFAMAPERFSLRCNGLSVSLESSLRAISPAGCKQLAIEIIPIKGDTSKSTAAVDADAAIVPKEVPKEVPKDAADAAPEVPKDAADAAPEVPKDAVDAAPTPSDVELKSILDVVMGYVDQVKNGEEKKIVKKRLHSKIQKPERTRLLNAGVEAETATTRASIHTKKFM